MHSPAQSGKPVRGSYFAKKNYKDDRPLTFEQARPLLPEPVLEKKPEYIESYWHAWEIAFRHLHVPSTESGLVSNFVDAAFNDNIFMWDTAFITMFCNLAHPYVPGIRSLDNFYCKQMDDGEIPRELVRRTGENYERWVNHDRKPLHSYFHHHYKHRGLGQTSDPAYEQMYKPDLGREPKEAPYFTLDNLNHPIMAWAELESYKHTGDGERLRQVWPPLLKYYEAMCEHLYNRFGLFVTDWASMDNSPRNEYLGSGVDISCEMTLFARNLAEIAQVLQEQSAAAGDEPGRQVYAEHIGRLIADAAKFSESINRYMWDEANGFYYDVQADGRRAPVKTIAAFWAMLAEVASREQADRLAAYLEDPKTFKRKHRVPVVAADEPGYNPQGGYWRGSVWAPTNTMVIRGLEKYGYHQLAAEIALNHLDAVVQVLCDTGSIWENYPPDEISSGDADRKDFVGWSGIGPILYLLEYAIGIKADAVRKELHWTIPATDGAVGCKRYWFAGITVDLLATHRPDGSVLVEAESDAPVTLHIQFGELDRSIRLNGRCEPFVIGGRTR